MLLVPKMRDLFAIGEVIMNGNETVSRVRDREDKKHRVLQRFLG